MNSAEVYSYYRALSAHFKNEKYDFFKYRGAIRNSKKSYNDLSDSIKMPFRKIAELREPKVYLVGNFIFGESNYIRDFKEEPYIEFRKFLTNGEYILKEDLGKLKTPLSINFKVDNQNEIPYILRALISGQISLFTVCVFQKLGNWTDKFNDNFILNPYIFKINKSYNFFKIDQDKYKKIILEFNK